MRPGTNASSPKAPTFTAANIAVLNAIKTSIATAATAQNYTGAALNGANKTPAPDGKAGYAQWPAATASNAAGAYVNGSAVTFTGTYKGVAVTRTATVVGTDGNATFIADGPLDGAVTAIGVGAQQTTGGAWTFGWVDLECRVVRGDYEPWREVRGSSAGNIGYVDADGVADILPCVAGEHHAVAIRRLKTSTTTVTLVTLYE